MEYMYANDEHRKRNVVIYARVSTEHEAQLSALENQKDWYKPFLEHHPEWNVIRMYVDEGITGTSAEKRPQFMRMMDDADNNEFDLILTREVSRFARNTVDTLQYTRELKAKGIEVFFINDNIKTFDGDGELRLTIMATLAQDESRKTSIRVKAGQQTSMENGVYYGNGNILGYDRVKKDDVVSFIQNPEQAKTVRMIFDWYLGGRGIRWIQFELERQHRLTATGKSNWHGSNISKILQNSFYCGIITYHKEFTPSYLEQKKIRNFGDKEFVKVKGRHVPIITEEEYEHAQELIAAKRRELKNTTAGKRQKTKGERQPIDVWTKLLVCECGHKFNRHAWHKTDAGIQYGYQCYSSIRTGTVKTRLKKGLPIEGICETPMITGWKLQMMAKKIFYDFFSDKERIFKKAQEYLDEHINDEAQIDDNSAILEQKQNELSKLEKRLDNLIEMRADGEISRDTFRAKKEDIEASIEKLTIEIDKLLPDEEEYEQSVEEDIEVLKFALDYYAMGDDYGKDIPEDMIEMFVEKIVAGKDGFEWYLRFYDPNNDGTKTIKCNVEGTRKSNAKVSPFGNTQHRLQSITNN